MKIAKAISYVSLVFLCGILLSCSKEKSGGGPFLPEVTVVCSINGLGDNGYNDLIMRGLMRFYEQNEVKMSLLSPANMEEVAKLLHKWLQESAVSESKRLLVLADNSYEAVLRAERPTLGDKQAILLLGSRAEDLPKGISTFHVNRYGVFYLAGCMVSPHCEAKVVAAMPGDATLKDAINGFCDGYREVSKRDADVIYLANDASGYAMPDSAYRTAAGIDNAFIIPLAGGSNSGIYKYSRESNFYKPLVAGMDVDCSLYSHRVPFSIVTHIDRIMEQFLSDWFEGKDGEVQHTYGLADKTADIVLSDVFYKNAYLFEDYYLDDAYWLEAYKTFFDEAVRKEEAYEKK